MDNKHHVIAQGEQSQAAGNDIYNRTAQIYLENPVFEVANADLWSLDDSDLLQEKEKAVSNLNRANSLRLKGSAVMAMPFIMLPAPALWLTVQPGLPSPYWAAAYIVCLLAIAYGLLRPMAEKLDRYRDWGELFRKRLELIDTILFSRGIEEPNWVNRMFKG